MRVNSVPLRLTSQSLQLSSFSFSSFLLLLLLLLTVFQTPILLVYAPPPTVRQVPSVDYPTIQSAIDASRRGDIVQVSPGTYYEHLIVPIAELIIKGENRETTIIDADTTGTAISLEAGGITITGFTLRNGGFNSGIRTSVYNSHNISNNKIEHFVEGIHFSDSDSNTISGNTFFNNSEYALNLRISQSNQINGNTITESVFGLYLYDVDGTTITRNTITNTSYGIFLTYSSQNTINGNTCQLSDAGIQAQSSDHLTINDNIITGGMYALNLQTTHYSQISNNSITQASYGLYLFSSNTNNIFGSPSLGNLITKNHWGLILYNSTGNTIIDGNTLAENVWGIYVTSNSNGNTIYHNNFIGNVDQAYQDWDLTNTYWNIASQGNYWDNYPGYGPAEGLDYYPLSEPWPMRNIAITNVAVSATQAHPGDLVNVNVTVQNLGVITETIAVTAHYNSASIENKTTTLTAGATKILTFNWNTANVVMGNYTISATTNGIPYVERNYTDNTFTDGTVQIGIPGDINNDHTVDSIDIQLLNQAYSATPAAPNWNPDADLNKDNIIDERDILILGKNYGTTA